MNYEQYGSNQTSQTTTRIERKPRHGKGRSERTYQNKIRRVKSWYNSFFNSSKEHSQTNAGRKKQRFFEKYPTFDAYLKVNPIKRSNIK